MPDQVATTRNKEYAAPTKPYQIRSLLRRLREKLDEQRNVSTPEEKDRIGEEMRPIIDQLTFACNEID